MLDENKSVRLSAISMSASRLSTTACGDRNTGADSRSALYMGWGSAMPAIAWSTNPSVSVMQPSLTLRLAPGNPCITKIHKLDNLAGAVGCRCLPSRIPMDGISKLYSF